MKKIRELNYDETALIHGVHWPSCNHCPLYRFGDNCLYNGSCKDQMNEAYLNKDVNMDREIEAARTVELEHVAANLRAARDHVGDTLRGLEAVAESVRDGWLDKAIDALKTAKDALDGAAKGWEERVRDGDPS